MIDKKRKDVIIYIQLNIIMKIKFRSDEINRKMEFVFEYHEEKYQS